MIQCAIVGATGYTGIELVRLLSRHPKVKLTCLTTRQEEPPELRSLLPELPKDYPLALEKFNFKEVVRRSDVVFSCLPHTESTETVAAFVEAGKIVIDLAADFRLKDAKLYKKWYGYRHPRKGLLKQAVYGLPELFRGQIQNAALIANPGCYATAAILGLAPLVEKDLIERDGIVIDAKSGVSGAGRKVTAGTFFGEVHENFKAYKVNQHQHMPEIEMALRSAAQGEVRFAFVPHLLPIERGILCTIYAARRKGVSRKAFLAAVRQAYLAEPFVRLCPDGEFPDLRDVQYTNFCDLGLWVKDSTNRVIVITAIDNLVKGASGQAVQNLNVRCGFPETMGLVLAS